MTFDVAAVRARFSALDRDLVFFDAPGGSQVPDEVIDAVSNYYRTSNANTSGPYETSRRTEALDARARETAGRFLGCAFDETVFGPNMTTLSFALSRTVGREFKAGDEIICTKLDHDANVSPWLELAHDKGLTVRFVDINEDTTLDLDDLQRQLTDRTRVVAFPVASNAVGTLTDVRRIADLAHEAGALAWADAVHYAPHGPIDVAQLGVDVLICSPYKYFGPHLGIAYGRRELLESWRPYKVRPAPMKPLGKRFETGTLAYELLAGFVAAVEYIDSIGWDDDRRVGDGARRAVPRRAAAVGEAPRAARDGRPRADLRVLGRRAVRGGGRVAPRRAGLRGLVGQLLRARGDEAARAGGRRRRGARRLRPLQHGRRGRPAARRARAAGVSGRREWWALGALVLLSTGLRAWAALEVPVPWITPDEMVYGMLGRSLWLHGSLAILGGPTPFYSLLTPALAGLPLAAFGLGTGYDVLHGLQPFVMSLAAVPVYLWGRTLVSKRSAFAAAALTLATPVLVYSGLLMTEVLFYPLLTVAAWAGAEAIARPTRRSQLLLLAAFAAVCATRIQAIVLVPALVTAALVDAGLARSWGRLRRHLPVAAGIGVLLVAWAVWRLSSGSAGARWLRRRREHVVQRRRGAAVHALPRRVAADPLRAVPGRRRRAEALSTRRGAGRTTTACGRTSR